MRPSTRFEVFKRDGFKCNYCGRGTPDVVLEVDHIVPQAEGGGDELHNLVTACWDCNRGKGATTLDSRAPVIDIETQTDLINERERQIRAYNEAKRVERERKNTDFEDAWNYWFTIWNVDSAPRYYTPHENALRRWVAVLGPDDVKDAMDIARAKFTYLNSNPVKYLAGICKWKIFERENRVAICSICKQRIELDEDEDPAADWVHKSCAEAG